MTADDVVNCLKVLKGNLAEYDTRHGLLFISASKFFLRNDIRTVKDTTSELRNAANQVAECESPSESEITAARSAVNAMSDAIEELKKSSRTRDNKNIKSRGIKGVVADMFGGNDSRDKEGEGEGESFSMGNKKVGSERILRAPDTVVEVVNSTLRDCFSGFPALKQQIQTAEKSLSPLFAQQSNEPASDPSNNQKVDSRNAEHGANV
ncbi:unnamed protein product [Phytophthora lilii]|uniref:Unnamed protein product n=1 Tax=Phytophthora lilii TaxID=2077276 RepID=A0A9W6TFE3_9STRA|nr:unnamed protein product [Phytophthora lilii]